MEDINNPNINNDNQPIDNTPPQPTEPLPPIPPIPTTNTPSETPPPTKESVQSEQNEFYSPPKTTKKEKNPRLIMWLFTIPVIMYPGILLGSLMGLANGGRGDPNIFQIVIANTFYFITLLYPISCIIGWILVKKNKRSYLFIPLLYLIIFILFALSPLTEKLSTITWKNYTNEEWGLSFKYPRTYTIVTNTVFKPSTFVYGDNGQGDLILEDNKQEGNPTLKLMFNKKNDYNECTLGNGDLFYITYIKDGKFVSAGHMGNLIPKDECNTNATPDILFNIGYFSDTLPTKNGISGIFSYTSGNYQDEFGKIIETIKVRKPELYGENMNDSEGMSDLFPLSL